MQRSSVLLPEPLAPIMLTTLPRWHVERHARSTSSGAEALVDVDDADARDVAHRELRHSLSTSAVRAMDKSRPADEYATSRKLVR